MVTEVLIQRRGDNPAADWGHRHSHSHRAGNGFGRLGAGLCDMFPSDITEIRVLAEAKVQFEAMTADQSSGRGAP